MTYQYQGSNPDAEVTEKQLNFIASLGRERGLDEGGVDNVAFELFPDAVANGEFSTVTELTRAQASELIDHLIL